MKRVARALGGFIPFSSLSRHKQRDEYIRLRTKIARTRRKIDQEFTNDLGLDEPGRPAFYNQWSQFYFLGLDGHTIWNTYLYTASHKYWGEISSLAHNEADRLNPRDTDRPKGIKHLFIPVYDASGRKLHYTMRKEEPVAAFRNKTRHEFMREYEAKLIHEDTGSTAPIFEELDIVRNYEYGIGIQAIVDAPSITHEVIAALVAKFRAGGEKAWRSEHPVPHDHLPKDTFINLATLMKETHEKSGKDAQ
jgi:hypothetical protein